VSSSIPQSDGFSRRIFRERAHRGAPGIARQEADLAEGGPLLEDRDALRLADLAVHRNAEPPRLDDEHGGPAVALPDDRLARSEPPLPGAVGDPAARLIGKKREEVDARDRGLDRLPAGRLGQRSGRPLPLADERVSKGDLLAVEPVPDPLADLRVELEEARVVLEPVAQLVGDRGAVERLQVGGRLGVSRDPTEVPARRGERRHGLGRRRLVLETHLERPRDRPARPREDLEAVAARDAVRNEQDVSFHRAQLDRAPGKLLDRPEGVSGSDHVADLNALLQMEREAREQVSERVLEGESNDDRQDRGRRNDAGQLDSEDDSKEDRRGDAEDEEADELPQERRSGVLPPQAKSDVEKEVVEKARQDECCRDPDRECAVIGVAARVRRRNPEGGQEQDDREDRRDEHERTDQVPDERRELLAEGLDPLERLHRAPILSTTARGSGDSWNRRTAATPAIRSRKAASPSRRGSSMPPMA
jgi:hypothetical protein